ncbi:uncharacterized protein LOC131465383 [Solea solea]|uniref:uncharacterized protein LOC131465383 n=1 Tax=Solea solea TaxID=90069 RepID=UPI00272994E7|nr:uncharacterized protein LOC131465383 [Solea solea]
MAEKMPPTTGASRKRKTFFEKATAKKNADAERSKTRVNIGAAAFERWRQLKDQRGLQSDAIVALFLLDRCEERCKQWLRAINHPKCGEDTDQEKLKNKSVCSLHFKGEMKKVTLTDTAIPSIFTVITGSSEHSDPEQSQPPTRETLSQPRSIQKATCEVGCQTDRIPGKRSVATQLSKLTLTNYRSAGCQATVATRSIAVGNIITPSPPLSSTSVKRKAVSPDDRPAKHPLLELPSFPESVTTTILVDPDEPTQLPSMSELEKTASEQAPTKPPQDMVKYLVYDDCLLELFKRCPICSSVCTVQSYTKGTFISVTQKCLHQTCLYTRQWKSQPLLGSTPAGNLHLSAAVLYTGSSFVQTKRVLNTMHLRTFSRKMHQNHVDNYILPSVLHKWRSHQTSLLQELKRGPTVTLGGDIRANIPGRCTKYGSYSMMDLNSNKVVDIQLVQSNLVGSSVHMEKEGLIRSLELLERSGVNVTSLVTDRRTWVEQLIQEQKPDIDHFYDVWRLCKAIIKKVDAISKEKDCRMIKSWQKSIENHLYWSASSSSSEEETVAKWTSLLNHMQNVHIHENPLFPKCLHPPSTHKRKWLKPATKPTYKLKKVLMNKHVLSCVKRLSPLYQTPVLKGFRSMIPRFAPKSLAFSYLEMLCRLYLAALHFNENSMLTQANTAAGEDTVQDKDKKKDHASTEYVAELMNLLFNEVIHNPAPFVAELKEVAFPGLLCSQFVQSETAEAVAGHVSTFGCSDDDLTPT